MVSSSTNSWFLLSGIIDSDWLLLQLLNCEYDTPVDTQVAYVVLTNTAANGSLLYELQCGGNRSQEVYQHNSGPAYRDSMDHNRLRLATGNKNLIKQCRDIPKQRGLYACIPFAVLRQLF